VLASPDGWRIGSAEFWGLAAVAEAFWVLRAAFDPVADQKPTPRTRATIIIAVKHPEPRSCSGMPTSFAMSWGTYPPLTSPCLSASWRQDYETD
jgi:hypothetical protein